MSCQEVRDFADAYVDSELDAVTAMRFERHLTECHSCRAFCEHYQKLVKSVQSQLPYFEAPERLEEKVRAHLGLASRTQPDRFVRWRWTALAASIALLLLFGALLWRIGSPKTSSLLAQEVVSSHIRSLMVNHLSDVASSDQHTVKPWFNGKLDFAPVVKDLASQGFPLTGGRLDFLDNRPVAALVYKHRQHTINLFQWPSPQKDSKLSLTTLRGYNVEHWTRAHMAYWAVSDLNAAELGEFAHGISN